MLFGCFSEWLTPNTSLGPNVSTDTFCYWSILSLRISSGQSRIGIPKSFSHDKTPDGEGLGLGLGDLRRYSFRIVLNYLIALASEAEALGVPEDKLSARLVLKPEMI